MKSIKQQYIDLREGNMTQANFMRNLRMSLPQYVTNITSFDDSVRILKNKGILTEADIKMITIEKEDIEDNIDNEEETSENNMLSNVSLGGAEISNRANPKDGFSLGFFEEGLDESIDTDLDSLADELDTTQKETIVSIIKKMLRKGASKLNTSVPQGAPTNPKDQFDLGYDTMGGVFETLRENKLTVFGTDKAIKMLKSELRNNNVEFEIKGNKVMVDDSPKAKMAIKMVKEREGMQSIKLSESKTLRENKDEKGKWTNTSGKSMYDQFKEIDNLNAQEVITGLDWEMEKNPELSKKDAAKIVIKNIKKNPLYYTMTDLAGKEGAEAQYMGPKADIEARQMQYLDKNMSNVVDKKMGMQPVKGIEKAKKDSDKGGETNKTVKGVELMSLIAKTVRGMKKMDATGEKMKKISVREGMESMNKINVNDEVKIDPEEIESINKPSKQVYSLPGKVNMKLNSEEIYKVKSILGMDAKLEDSKGNEAGYVNMSNLIKVIDENTDREKYRDDYNARARSSDTEQAKKDAEKNKKDTETQLNALKGNSTDAALASFPGLRERLKELIRKEIKESAGAYDYGDDMSADDINEADDSNIYLVASPEKNSGELWSLFSNSENLFRAGYWKMTEEMFNQMMMPSNPSIYKFNNELWFVYTNRNGKLNVWPMDPKYKSVDVISTKNTKEEAVKDAANRAELVRADFRDSDKKLDTILNKAAGDIDSLVKQIGNDTKLGWDLYKRARVVDPSLADDLAQALNLYNK